VTRSLRYGQTPRGIGEVEAGLVAAQGHGGDVVGPGRHLGGGEGPEPDPGLLVGLAHLADPPAPVGAPCPDPFVERVAGLPELGPARPLLRRGRRNGGVAVAHLRIEKL